MLDNSIYNVVRLPREISFGHLQLLYGWQTGLQSLLRDAASQSSTYFAHWVEQKQLLIFQAVK